MITANWENLALSVKDGETEVAGGLLEIKDGEYYISFEEYETGQGFGDFAARVLLRRAFDMGAGTQYALTKKDDTALFKKLGFSEISREGDLVKLRRVGDILGDC
ncbi:hypothetical protein AGMMS49975_05680 [Clostridia bacterium]|nr:hypothetical protein AGMMS49975_05680 [Clostridia bacterium]